MESYGLKTRAHWAAVAARLSVAAVDGRCNSRGWESSSGRVGMPVQAASWILWKAIPAYGLPSGTCIRIRKSSSQRASSSTSGTPLPRSGIRRVESPSADALPARLARAKESTSVQAEIPPLTTYLPWSPASYQPPRTSWV